MLLFNAENLSKSFGTKTLFENISISLFEGDRVGLIGQNGSGKSTLLKIIAGLEKEDGGTISARKGLNIGYLPQTCDFAPQKPLDVLLEAFQGDEYEKDHVAKMWLSKVGFKGNEPLAHLLSGGWKKRLALAKEMVNAPDLLLLDEPTNHLDLEAIFWLEKFLKREARSYILVSHDRTFLERTTNRMIELGSAYPGGLFSIEGSYRQFLEKKEQFLDGQLQQERSLATKVRRETAWLQTSPKARTTKAQSRIDQAQQLLEDFSDIKKRNLQKGADIEFTASKRETRKLLVANNICKNIAGRPLFKGLGFTLTPGARIGLMGPNGSGKTTLLRILASEIEIDQGTIKRAEGLKTVYFDQHRNKLSDDMTLRDALSPTGDFVTYQGRPIHVNGWCKRFLFSPDLLDMPLAKLSGGERARISIAHLMLQPADLLLLDEPTNDLDIPTLEILETTLLDFPGALVLITHDRCMLERLCNSFLPLGDPNQHALFSSYAQWEASLKKEAEEVLKPVKAIEPTKSSKLSYKEKKEHGEINGKILKLEQELKELTHLLESEEVSGDHKKLSDVCAAIALAETQVEQLYLRWEELSSRL